MFTGIIENCVSVDRVDSQGTGMRIHLPAPSPDWAVEEGESVAVSGVCLTVAALFDPKTGNSVPDGTPGAQMAFDLSQETLERTWFGELGPGARVNLERAMRMNDRLSGHMVSGHVDGGASLVAIEDPGDGGFVYRFEVDENLSRYLIEKGSIGIDGISLTVVQPVGRRFDVALIPLTLDCTNLGSAEIGRRFNIEVDMVGKWIEKLLSERE